jgi:integrase
MKRKAWQRQKNLQKQYSIDDLPDIKELVNIINNIKIGRGQYANYYTSRARALFSLYYLTGCRASEIVKCNNLRITKKEIVDKKVNVSVRKIEHNYQGIKKEDLVFTRIDGKQCIIIRTENRKHKNRKTKKLPIPIEFEKPIVYFLIDYLLNYIEKDEILFPFGIKRATQIINQTTGWNIHFLRHIRATHLVTKYDYNEQLLIKFLGWSDSRPAKAYMELNTKDLFRQFYGGKNEL